MGVKEHAAEALQKEEGMDPTVEQDAVVEGLSDESNLVEDGGGTPPADTEMFTVKVDGEDVQVTRDELLNGYSRQQDYTRKTQQLAAEREQYSQLAALAAALDRDPAGTLAALQEAYGLNQQDEPSDPEEARIAQLERFVAEQQEAARQAAFDRQIASLQQRFGDVDEVALLEHAIRHGISDLEAAYAHMNFQKVYEEAQAAKAKAQEEENRKQAKRGAQVVAGGGNRQAGSTTVGDGNAKPSFMDAWNMARQQLGSS